MSFPRYPAYKDSGVEWLGEVPEHWEIKPFFSRFSEHRESNRGMRNDNLLSLSFGRIVNKDINTLDGLLPDSYETYQVVYPGDIVFRLTDLQNDKRSLRSAIVSEKGIITSAYLAVTGFGISATFGAYLFRSYDLMKVFYSMGGGLRQSMKFEDMKRLPIICPGPEEQAQIARFLDHETAKIDALIQEQQRLIELLKEKRQAVISHAVTKGLDPSVPMKDSGVEWLGEVPEHWELKKVSHTCEIRNNLRTPIDRDIRAGKAGPFPYYGPTGVLDHIDEFSVEGEHFLLGEDGDHFLKFEDKPMTIVVDGKFSVNNHAHLIKGRSGFSTQWGSLFFEARDLAPWLIKQGVGRYKLRKESLQNIPVLVPPEQEQARIVEHLRKLKIVLNVAAEVCSDTVALLQERRSALISAAVTGKIDVRNWNPPADEHAFDEEVRQTCLEAVS